MLFFSHRDDHVIPYREGMKNGRRSHSSYPHIALKAAGSVLLFQAETRANRSAGD